MKFRYLGRILGVMALALLAAIQSSANVSAVEGGKQTYLLGAKGPQAGMLPPPGLFEDLLFYTYTGEANPNINVPFDGNITVNADVVLNIAAPTLLWVPDLTIGGGRLGFLGILPIGSVDVAAGAILAGPGGAPIVGASLTDTSFTVGDPQIGAVLGWNSGAFHWNFSAVANVPIGRYDKGALANLGFNRWSVDLGGSATWFDPQVGFELSTTAGFTLNGENSATNYESGDEFHIEFAALHHVSREFNWGLVGYHYEQITGDSGAGAVLGSFKGRVTALGPHVGFTLPIAGKPIGIKARFYSEFNVKNRLEGHAGYVTISIPLFISQPPSQAPQ